MTLGSALAPGWTVNGLSLTTSPYGVEMDGPDLGTPDLTVDVLVSFLTRGDLEQTSHTGNRTLTLPVIIEGTNLAALATAEAALFEAIDQPSGEVVFVPGDSIAAATVFEVFRGSMTLLRSDVGEMAGIRRYTLTFRALPNVLSAQTTTVAALPASGSTTTNVDTGSTATGWTAAVEGATVTPTAVTGPPTTVTATSTSAVLGDATILMTRSGTITTSTLKTLTVDWKAGPGVTCGPLSAVGNGATLTRIADTASPTAGYTRSWFSVTATSLTTLQLLLTTTGMDSNTAVTRSLSIDNIAVTDARPGSAKQQARTLAIDGSAPTTGSLAVQHATTGLGDVIAYTCPDDGSAYSPPCRAYFGTAGTTDAAAASGFYTAVVGGAANLTATVPVPAVPSGEYLLMLSARSITSPSTLAVTVSTAAPSGTIITAPAFTPTVAASGSYVLSRLGMLHLPQADVASSGTVVVSIQNTAGGVTCRVDEVYLFNLTTGRLTQVACGSATRLWIDSPSLDNDGLGRYLMGSAADRSDAYSAYPSAQAIGLHEFRGGKSLKVFTVTAAPTTAADVSFTYRAAWHSNAAA